MANRYIGDYPVIGIRPIVDGRRGPQMMRESLEPLVWAMAEAAKKLAGEKVEDVGIAGVWYNAANIDEQKAKNIFYMG